MRGECVYVCEFIELKGKESCPSLPAHTPPHDAGQPQRENKRQTLVCRTFVCLFVWVMQNIQRDLLQENCKHKLCDANRLLENNTFLCVLLHQRERVNFSKQFVNVQIQNDYRIGMYTDAHQHVKKYIRSTQQSLPAAHMHSLLSVISCALATENPGTSFLMELKRF